MQFLTLFFKMIVFALFCALNFSLIFVVWLVGVINKKAGWKFKLFLQPHMLKLCDKFERFMKFDNNG